MEVPQTITLISGGGGGRGMLELVPILLFPLEIAALTHLKRLVKDALSIVSRVTIWSQSGSRSSLLAFGPATQPIMLANPMERI